MNREEVIMIYYFTENKTTNLKTTYISLKKNLMLQLKLLHVTVLINYATILHTHQLLNQLFLYLLYFYDLKRFHLKCKMFVFSAMHIDTTLYI